MSIREDEHVYVWAATVTTTVIRGRSWGSVNCTQRSVGFEMRADPGGGWTHFSKSSTVSTSNELRVGHAWPDNAATTERE
jgi:hypothetical protein